MTYYRVVVLQSSGNREAILDYAEVRYEQTFNEMNTASVTIPANKDYDLTKFGVYSKTGGESGIIYIYRGGNLEFKGKITRPKIDSSGNYVFACKGMEILSKEKNTGGDYTFVSQNAATTRTTLVAAVTGISIGTNGAFSGDPLGALDLSDRSVLSAIHEVTVDNANQDWSMTYKDDGSNDLINFETHKGSSTSVQTLVQGLDISEISSEEDYEGIYNKITVVGSGVGNNRLSVTVNDAASQTANGIREPERPFLFKNVKDTVTLTDIANRLLAEFKDLPKRTLISVKDIAVKSKTNTEIVAGDVITVRDPKTNINRNVRILKITRVIRDKREQLFYEITETGKHSHFGDLMSRLESQARNQINNEAFPWDQFVVKTLFVNSVINFSPTDPVYLYGVRVASAGYIIIPEIAAPGTPGAGIGALYEKTDGKIYFKNDVGTEYDLTTAVSGTTGRIPKFSSASAIGDSLVEEVIGAWRPTASMTLGDSANRWANIFSEQGNFSGDVVVDTSVFKVNTTNDRVGVGTASPSATLHVSDTSTGSGMIISKSNIGAALLFSNSGSGNDITGNSLTWSVTKTGDGTFASMVIGGETAVTENVVTINNTLPKWVGTSSLGNSALSDTGTAVECGSVFRPNASVALGGTANRWTTIYGAAGDFSGNLTVGGANLDALSAVGSFAKINIGGSSSLELFVNGEASISGNLTVDSGTFFVDSVNNRVGVGTTSPDQVLHSSKSIDGDSILFLLENSQTNIAASVNETAQIRFGFGGDNDVARIVVGKEGDYTTAANSDSSMKFYTDSNGAVVLAMTIDEFQRVGIGTGPSATLHVSDTSTGSGMIISKSNIGAALLFSNSGSGNDITGTSTTWSVTKAGVGNFDSITVASTSKVTNLNSDRVDSLHVITYNITPVSQGPGTVVIYDQTVSLPSTPNIFCTPEVTSFGYQFPFFCAWVREHTTTLIRVMVYNGASTSETVGAMVMYVYS